MDDILINHDREKLINIIIYFAKNTKYCGLTKLFKLLHFADFLHFKETGRSITNLSYDAWRYGPVPGNLYKEFKSEKLPEDLKKSISIINIQYDDPLRYDRSIIKVKPKIKFDDFHLSKREKRIVDEVATTFRDVTAKEISKISHMPKSPWHITIEQKGEYSNIDYILAINNPGSINKEEAKEIERDHEKIREFFLRYAQG